MKIPLKISTIMILIAVMPFAMPAQSIHTVSNHNKPFKYTVPDDIALSTARKKAIQGAQLNLIAEEFNTVIQEDINVFLNDNGTDINLLTTSFARGEWIETIDEPEILLSIEDNQVVMTVRIKGKVREIKWTKPSFQSVLLRNDPEASLETTDFRSGDRLFLSFQSAASGYLAVYMEDDSKVVHCLLPYRASEEGIVKIKANTNYVFFSREHAKPLFEPAEVDRYRLEVDEGSAAYHVYILFSTNPFTKANDQSADGVPRYLSRSDFLKWIAKSTAEDIQMQKVIKTITVTH